MRDWVATTETRWLSVSAPPTLDDDVADVLWAAMTPTERRTWWVAWANGRIDESELPTEPWRADLVLAIIAQGRRRARRTFAVLAVAVPVVLSVLMGVSPGDGVAVDVVVDLLPAVALVVVLASWNEVRTADVLARCRARRAAARHDRETAHV